MLSPGEGPDKGSPLWTQSLFVAAIAGAVVLLVGLAVAVAVGVHRRKQRKQYECLPYTNQVITNDYMGDCSQKLPHAPSFYLLFLSNAPSLVSLRFAAVKCKFLPSYLLTIRYKG